jgi:hypothetical protein
MVRERQPRVCVIGPLMLEEERELANLLDRPNGSATLPRGSVSPACMKGMIPHRDASHHRRALPPRGRARTDSHVRDPPRQ